MNSKTSCFNKTLLKCDIKRLWWTGALAAFAMFLCTALPFLQAVRFQSDYYDKAERIANLNRDFVSFSYLGIICGMVAALCISALLFAYMNKSSSVSCIHGLPVSRKTLYFTHLLSGFVLLLIPVVINVLFILSGLASGLQPVLVLKFVLQYIIYSLGILTIATLVGMLTGNSAAHIVFTVVAVLMPMFIVVFADTVFSSNFYGYYNSEAMYNFITKYIYIMPDGLLSFRVLIYVAAILIFIFLGLLCYKKRGLENHGEVIAFPKLKWLFKLMFAFCSGVLGYFYVSSVWGMNNLLMLIPFAIIGLVIAHMLTQKSFTLKGIVPTLLAIVAINLGLFAVVHFDVFGYETRVPDVDDVKSVTFADISGRGNYYTRVDGIGALKQADYYIPTFTSPEEIKMFTDLQSYKIKHRDTDYEDGYINFDGINQNVCIQYNLKNGRKMYRCYYLSAKECDKYLRPICETKEYLAYYYPVLDESITEVDRIEIEDVRNSEASALCYFKGTEEEAKQIIEALRKDKINTTLERFASRNMKSGITTISVTYYTDGIDENGKLVKKSFKNTDDYVIEASDVNTLALLNELGVFNMKGFEKKENLSKITVHFDEMFVDGKYIDYQKYGGAYDEAYEGELAAASEVKSTSEYSPNSISTITDKSDMEEIYNFVFEGGLEYPYLKDSTVRMNMSFYYNDGYSFAIDVVSEPDLLPDVLKDYIKAK